MNYEAETTSISGEMTSMETAIFQSDQFTETEVCHSDQGPETVVCHSDRGTEAVVCHSDQGTETVVCHSDQGTETVICQPDTDTRVFDALTWREQCSECDFWVKYSLFVINFLVWTAGCVMVGIGAWARLQKKGLTFFDHVMTDPAYMLILVGTIMLFISIFGCIGALRENVCLLRMYILTIVAVFIVQVVAAVLAFVLMDKVEAAMMNYMQNAIVHYGDDDDIREAIDYLQKQFYCCGASNFKDWEVNPHYNCSSSIVSRCGVPRSCCRVPTSVHCGFGIREYLDTYAEQFIFTNGCIGPLMIVFKDNLIVIGLIALSVGILELFSMLLAHSMVKHIVVDQKNFQ